MPVIDYVPIVLRPPEPKQPPRPEPRPRALGSASCRFKLLRRFWKHPHTPRLSHAEQTVWFYMWSLADRGGICYPSHARIGKRIGCTERYAKELTRKLRLAGFLELVKPGSNVGGDDRANVYRLKLPGAATEGEPECPQRVNQSVP